MIFLDHNIKRYLKISLFKKLRKYEDNREKNTNKI